MPTSKVLVAGLVNLETTLAIEGFPLDYYPVNYAFDGVQTSPSGVGLNLALALHTLGSQVELLAKVGEDPAAAWVKQHMQQAGLSLAGLEATLQATPASVILYEPSGRRQIQVDLKDSQEQSLEVENFQQLASEVELAIISNSNFCRGLLQPAKDLGLTVATDVHTLADLDDQYNRDYLAAADILFLSDEGLHGRDARWFISELEARYHNQIIVMGQGANGSLMYVAEDRQFYRVPAHSPRAVVNSIGAGDALFACFIHHWLQHRNPYRALTQASYFAGWKIGEAGAAQGFMTEQALAELMEGS